MSKRIAITGSSGYLGSRMVQKFLDEDFSVLGVDTKPPTIEVNRFNSILADVSSELCLGSLKDFKPDIVMHTAFVFQPLRNRRLMHLHNIGSFERLSKVVAQISPSHFHVVSSATVYGAAEHATHRLPEDTSFHRSQFQYAMDKQEIERGLADFAKANPQIATSWSRPCLIGGPSIDNYMSRFLFGMPFLALPDGNDTPLQFVHEDDVVSAILKIVESGQTGPFNIGPADSTPLSVIAQKTDRKSFRLPYWLCYGVHALAWHLRLPRHESPPTLLEFARHPWMVDSSRLVEELGFQFQYSSDQTLDIMIEQLRR